MALCRHQWKHIVLQILSPWSSTTYAYACHLNNMQKNSGPLHTWQPSPAYELIKDLHLDICKISVTNQPYSFWSDFLSALIMSGWQTTPWHPSYYLVFVLKLQSVCIFGHDLCVGPASKQWSQSTGYYVRVPHTSTILAFHPKDLKGKGTKTLHSSFPKDSVVVALSS